MKRTPLIILAAGVALAFVPQLGLPAFYDSLLYLMLHWIVLATSWNILSLSLIHISEPTRPY